MKLSAEAMIAPEKLKNYLLAWRARNDKSRWLACAGYTRENWETLEYDLRMQILPLEARPLEMTAYGRTYEIIGQLSGPNGITLTARSIWMLENMTGQTKLITLYPYKEGSKG